MKIAERVNKVPPSGIRRFFEIAEELDNVISLGVGEPDFPPPWDARKAASVSLERGYTSYTTNRGKKEVREAISKYVKKWDLSYSFEDEILITTGVSEGVDLAIRALVEKNDKVAIVSPSYVSYLPVTIFAGGDPLLVSTNQENKFKISYKLLEESGASDADILILSYPNNPTGAIMEKKDLKEVADFAKENDIFIVSDEVYSELTYGKRHFSIASLKGMKKRSIVLNGFSKAYAMTGMRLGYALGPKEIISAMNRIHQYTMLSAPTTAQNAACQALESRDEVQRMKKEFDKRRRFTLSRLDKVGIDCFKAEGAFYLFPKCPRNNDETFAEDLLKEEKVALVPGRVFGDEGKGHLRLSYATDMDDLKKAMERLERFVN